jgi:cell division septation protein DedD
MRLLSSTRRRRKPAHGKGFSEKPSQRPTGPKNGPLTIAVAGTIALLVALSLLNYRLIRNASVNAKAVGSRHSSEQGSMPPPASCGQFTDEGVTSTYVPPKVTFYRQLTQADRDPREEEAKEGSIQADHQPQNISQETSPESQQSARPRSTEGFSTAATAPGTAQPRPELPEISKGPARYTVQVGAFTDPAIAQQWAQKWKARGYKVTLRPVARPRSGVSYRLYLGRFSSQKKADELVRRLKRREGIRALRLLVRN